MGKSTLVPSRQEGLGWGTPTSLSPAWISPLKWTHISNGLLALPTWLFNKQLTLYIYQTELLISPLPSPDLLLPYPSPFQYMASQSLGPKILRPSLMFLFHPIIHFSSSSKRYPESSRFSPPLRIHHPGPGPHCLSGR